MLLRLRAIVIGMMESDSASQVEGNKVGHLFLGARWLHHCWVGYIIHGLGWVEY